MAKTSGAPSTGRTMSPPRAQSGPVVLPRSCGGLSAPIAGMAMTMTDLGLVNEGAVLSRSEVVSPCNTDSVGR